MFDNTTIMQRLNLYSIHIYTKFVGIKGPFKEKKDGTWPSQPEHSKYSKLDPPLSIAEHHTFLVKLINKFVQCV